MAISFVGAATIWRFVYEARPEGQAQIGLLNAIVTKFGFDPVSWLQFARFNLNDLLLMVIRCGCRPVSRWCCSPPRSRAFVTTRLRPPGSTAPPTADLLQGRGPADLGDRRHRLHHRAHPGDEDLRRRLRDDRWQLGTEVIGNRFFRELFILGNNGRAAALVVILLVAVTPVMMYQVSQFRGSGVAAMTTTPTPAPTLVRSPDTTATRTEPRRRFGGHRSPVPGHAGWLVKGALLTLCLAWLLPTIGLLVTSFRTREAAENSGWWTALASPLDFSQWMLATTATSCSTGAWGTRS